MLLTSPLTMNMSCAMEQILRGCKRKEEQYKNPDNDPRGPWTSANMVGLATEDARPNLHYDLIDPSTGINYGKPTKGWRYDKKYHVTPYSEGRMIWPDTPNGRPRKKQYLADLAGLYTGYSSTYRRKFGTLGQAVISNFKSGETFALTILRTLDVLQELIDTSLPDER